MATRYKAQAGSSYETECSLELLIYEGHRYVHHKGMDLVNAMKVTEEERKN